MDSIAIACGLIVAFGALGASIGIANGWFKYLSLLRASLAYRSSNQTVPDCRPD